MRQPGSSFKPIVYATALDNGYTPSTLVLDGPVEIDQGPGMPTWRPENYSAGKYNGPSTLRFGIEQSRNTMTVRLAQDVGMPLIVEYARRFGVYDNLPTFCRIPSAPARPRCCAWSPPIRCSTTAASASFRPSSTAFRIATVAPSTGTTSANAANARSTTGRIRPSRAWSTAASR
jgi:hypothetical protein